MVPSPVVAAAPELPKASVIFVDKPDPIRFLMAFSSAPDTLARCFFRGLPAVSPFAAFIAGLNRSDAEVAVADAVGGLVDKLDEDCLVSPEAEVSVASALLLPDKEAAECWRLS